jgi:predicted PurR-regulated permease PerM
MSVVVPPIHKLDEEYPVGNTVDVDLSDTLDTSHTTAMTPEAAGSLALNILAATAVVFTLEWAQSLIISLLLGVIFAYTLNPIVVWLERVKIPRTIGSCVVMLAVVCAFVFGTYALRGQMQAIFTQLPEAVSKLSTELASMRNVQSDNMRKIQNAASDMEKATSPAVGNPLSSEKATAHVVVDAPALKFGNFLWTGSKGVLGIMGQAAMVVFLVFFLLLAGDTFKRKLVRITGPSLSRRKITVHILDDINNSIQRYMFMLLMTNVLVALLAWLVFHWIGLENAGAWAVAAGLLHVIPYFGPGITAVAATVVGTFITTWLTGRIAKMNTAAVFISLLFWSWLWGVWGMLLSMPIIVILKVVSQHVEKLQPVSEMLGE